VRTAGGRARRPHTDERRFWACTSSDQERHVIASGKEQFAAVFSEDPALHILSPPLDLLSLSLADVNRSHVPQRFVVSVAAVPGVELADSLLERLRGGAGHSPGLSLTVWVISLSFAACPRAGSWSSDATRERARPSRVRTGSHSGLDRDVGGDCPPRADRSHALVPGAREFRTCAATQLTGFVAGAS
jgi:hypothetical protein